MKFLMLFYGLAGEPGAADEQTVAYSQKWGEYMGSLGQQGKLVSALPLDWSGKSVTREAVADLEMHPVDIGGYMIIEVDSEADALEVARGAPHVALGGTTVVRRCDESRIPSPG
jgi:hypothetical protein